METKTFPPRANRLMTIWSLLFLVCMWECTIVDAVDVDGYTSNTACSGGGKSCRNIAQRICCQFAGLLPRAALIGYLNFDQFAVIYTGNHHLSCGTSLASQSGQGRKCFVRFGSIYGADWYSIMRSASAVGSAEAAQAELSSDAEVKEGDLQADQSIPACTATVRPNAVIYSSDSSQGKWVLESHADQHDALLSELETVEEGNKEKWLQSRGAYYVKNKPL